MKQADDREIWEWARDDNHTLVTTDSDFVAMVTPNGPPPKVIHIERCDFPFSRIEDLLRQNAIRISRFENDESGRLLTLRTVRSKNNR
jgi:predicted nuclease of predicted toxin-antitoxin system